MKYEILLTSGAVCPLEFQCGCPHSDFISNISVRFGSLAELVSCSEKIKQRFHYQEMMVFFSDVCIQKLYLIEIYSF